jgi:NAD(P)-dependent dehydrogenase (short-subunit alcohol dehydrogenase family)
MAALDFANKRVVVTGAAGGLGRAFAEGFAQEGAQIIVADINLKGAEETVARLRANGTKAHALHLDVTDAASCAALHDAAQDLFGGLDILVNNAAAVASVARKPFWELDPSDWDMVLSVNVKGLWQVSRALFPVIKQAGGGAIVNLASVTAYSGSPLWMHYVASKGAVISMTRVMAKELGPYGIRVNALAPGLVPTEAVSGLIEGAETYGIDKLALGRQATAEDIVGGALFFASGMSDFITGQTMIIDGGRQFV